MNQNTERNVGPGSYNPKYVQSPKGFISSLGRPAIFSDSENNKDVGPGSYEVSSSFDMGHKILSPYHSKLEKKCNDKENVDMIWIEKDELNNIDLRPNFVKDIFMDTSLKNIILK